MKLYRSLSAVLLLSGCAVAGPAVADDVAALRGELQALKADYSARVEALEQRIAQLETQLSAAEAMASNVALADAAPATPVSAAQAASGATAFRSMGAAVSPPIPTVNWRSSSAAGPPTAFRPSR